MLTVTNILKNSIKRKNLLVMLKKAIRRLEKDTSTSSAAWCRSKVSSYEKYAKSLDEALYFEAKSFAESFSEKPKAKLSNMNVEIGGGGFY